MAHSLAIAKKKPLGYEHLIEAMEANEEFGKQSSGELFLHPKECLELHDTFKIYSFTDASR